MDELQKGDYVYYAQIFKPPVGEYNVIELKIHMINAEKQYFTGFETNESKRTFLFKFADWGKNVFTSYDMASAMIKEAEKQYGKTKKNKEV